MTVLTQELLKKLLRYEPDTGLWLWLARTPDMFNATKRPAEHACDSWNKKFAGTIAGTPDKDGYIQIRLLGKIYKAHRLAFLYMTGDWPTEEMVDHEDTDPSNNIWSNIRDATRGQNAMNTGVRKDNKLGEKCIRHLRGKYQVDLQLNKKRYYIGRFDSLDRAILERDKHIKLLHQEFARI